MANHATVNRTGGLDPMHAEPVGHGNSVAAWAAVGVMLVGALVACIGFTFHQPVVFYIGLGVMVVGLLVGWIMRAMGYGVGGSKTKPSNH